MSSLPAFLDVEGIQEQLRGLGHSVDATQIHDLLLELGFGSTAVEEDADGFSAAECDLTRRLSHLQVSPAAPEPQPESSCGDGAAEEDADFVWSGRSTAQPPLSALLPPLAEYNTAPWVLPEDPAGVPSAAYHRPLTNATNSPRATAARPWADPASSTCWALPTSRSAHPLGQQEQQQQQQGSDDAGLGADLAPTLPLPTSRDALARLYAAAGLAPPSVCHSPSDQSASVPSYPSSGRPSSAGEYYHLGDASCGRAEASHAAQEHTGSGAAHFAARSAARRLPGSTAAGAVQRAPTVGSFGRPPMSGAAAAHAAARGKLRTAGSKPQPGSKPLPPKKRADPVSTFASYQKRWEKDRFLQHGGDSKVPRRKTDGFREMFATLHAIEAARR